MLQGGSLMRSISRRTFLAQGFDFAGASLFAHAWEGKIARTRLILLGTGGGPRPRKASSASAQVIVNNNTAYVIDCGNAVARQLVFANVPLISLRHVFVTHNHSDHNADYGDGPRQFRTTANVSLRPSPGLVKCPPGAIDAWQRTLWGIEK